MAEIVDKAKDIGSTFTNWDRCMSETYCKWPVIAVIILAAVIALSIIWCVASCLCCGMTLCGACVKCITCGNCCGACRGGGRRRRDPEYHPMPPTPQPYHGYQPQPSPMMYNHGGPQFATFDAGTKRDIKVHDDSLPAMPSWDNASTRRVEDHAPQHQQRASDMEMERMLPQSPMRQQPYGKSQPYASDLGAQRMGQQGENAQYYDSTPLSPAPTYRTTGPNMAGPLSHSHQDRFSPPQDDYNSPYAYDRGNAHSVAPYPSSRESTQFASQRSFSPPSAPSYSPYQSLPIDQSQGVRPPSLLQVGRKPVPGSHREV